MAVFANKNTLSKLALNIRPSAMRVPANSKLFLICIKVMEIETAGFVFMTKNAAT